MYINVLLLSVAMPAINRHTANIGVVSAKMVKRLPIIAIIFDNISTGKRPILSANMPNVIVPITDPTKNSDWPSVDCHAC